MPRLPTLIASLSLGAALFSATGVRADEPICSARADMVAKLSKHFKEIPAALGVVDERAVLEVFVSDSGTWTILATGTDGKSCVISSGEGWQSTTVVAGAGV